MKKYLKIQNDGILDPRLITLMGGTTKAGQEHKIGQFGTGLKYVLAYMVRNKIDFKLCIDGKNVPIGYVEETIANDQFKILTVGGEKTSVTDKMGLTWKPWMIVRELYSNALDEGGAVYTQVNEDDTDAKQEKGKTIFYIELTPDFLQVFNDWNKYFIVNSVPMYENDMFALHPTSGHLKIYKQGILIKEDTQSPALFSYDLKNADINELREYTGVLANDLSHVIFKIDDPQVVQYFIEHVGEKKEGKELFEACVDLEWWQEHRTMNTAWQDTIGEAKVIHPEAYDKIMEREPNSDLSYTVKVPKNLYKALTRCFKGVGALKMAGTQNEFFEVIDTELSAKAVRCCKQLEEVGYVLNPEIKFLFGEFSNTFTLAQVNTDTKEVFVSTKMKDKSDFEFCSMLVEENEHIKTGYSDLTRPFQSHFIQLYTKQLLESTGGSV